MSFNYPWLRSACPDQLPAVRLWHVKGVGIQVAEAQRSPVFDNRSSLQVPAFVGGGGQTGIVEGLT